LAPTFASITKNAGEYINLIKNDNDNAIKLSTRLAQVRYEWS